MDENTRRKALREKLQSKIREKSIQRSSNEVKENVVDNNLKNLGINNSEELKTYLQSIKDLDKGELSKSLEQFGISRDQLNQFYKQFNI